MALSFHTWIDFQITHDYFNHSPVSCFRLRPVSQTAHWASNDHFHLQLAANGFSASRNARFDALASAADADASGLVFQVFTDDPLFTQYTALPEFSKEEVCYLSNATGLVGGQVHRPSASDWLPVVAPAFRWPVSEGVETVTITRANGAPVSIGTPAIAGGFASIDLRAYGEGGYVLSFAEKRVPVVVMEPSVSSRPFAVVEVFPEKLDGQQATYEVNFQAQKVHWSYDVVARSIDFSEVDLGLEEQEAGFSGPEDASAFGRPVKRFTSLEALPLLQRPSAAYKLVVTPKNNHSGLRGFERALPSPSPSSVQAEFTEGGKGRLQSNMYIYI